MSHTVNQRADVDAVSVFYREAGPPDAPTILLLHGLGLGRYTLFMQEWLRAHQPPLLVVWGRYDPSFQAVEAEAYRRDVPDAEVHLLDAGHFALDEQPDQVAALTRGFLQP